MGLFDKLFKKQTDNEDKQVNTNNAVGNSSLAQQVGKVSLSKEDRVAKINLAKEEVHKVSLAKPALNNLTSRVAIVLDYSMSMDRLYKDGTVQGILETALPIAMQFDDNGKLEVWIFEDRFNRLPDMDIDNFYGYVQREIIDKRYSMGGTNYAPVIRDIINKYRDEEPMNIPSYVIFITDGDNWDKDETTKVIREASHLPIFWQFIGVGSASMSYLENLDDMDGRYVDNADFFQVAKADQVTYDKMLDEYPVWVSDSKVKEMLSN